MHTFVVRVHESERDDAAVRGVVDEVATGRRTTFRDGSELVEILKRGREDRDEADRTR